MPKLVSTRNLVNCRRSTYVVRGVDRELLSPDRRSFAERHRLRPFIARAPSTCSLDVHREDRLLGGIIMNTLVVTCSLPNRKSLHRRGGAAGDGSGGP
jgi:hypothetical protein